MKKFWKKHKQVFVIIICAILVLALAGGPIIAMILA